MLAHKEATSEPTLADKLNAKMQQFHVEDSLQVEEGPAKKMRSPGGGHLHTQSPSLGKPAVEPIQDRQPSRLHTTLQSMKTFVKQQLNSEVEDSRFDANALADLFLPHIEDLEVPNTHKRILVTAWLVKVAEFQRQVKSLKSLSSVLKILQIVTSPLILIMVSASYNTASSASVQKSLLGFTIFLSLILSVSIGLSLILKLEDRLRTGQSNLANIVKLGLDYLALTGPFSGHSHANSLSRFVSICNTLSFESSVVLCNVDLSAPVHPQPEDQMC